MDSLITAAARALAAGDLLGALNRVALREDPPALALRGIAMARLGDLPRAKALLKAAAKGFGPREAVARARCVVAEAEIALVSRDLGWPAKTLEAARVVLEARGDWLNAAHARHLEVRRLLLVGRLDEAERILAMIDPAPFPPAWRTGHELAAAGVAMRRVRAGAARTALRLAAEAARRSAIAGLVAEVEAVQRIIDAPAARLIAKDAETMILLDEVEALFASRAVVVDACRNVARGQGSVVALTRRPVLFALLRALAEAWPGDASRDVLIARAFGARHVDESHRARLRVEIGRLRAEIARLADIEATKDGFVLKPHDGREVVVLAPPVEDEHAAVLALLGDGEAWASSSLAEALGASQRTIQRALDDLAEAGKIQPVGQGRARRWMTPPTPGFPTSLLLSSIAPGG